MDAQSCNGWVRSRPRELSYADGSSQASTAAVVAAATTAATVSPSSSSSSSSVPALGSNSFPDVNQARTTRACDRCKKKIRCSGTQPCEACIRATTSCAYATPYNRGRKPPPPRLVTNSEPPESSDAASQQERAEPQERMQERDTEGHGEMMTTVESISRASPEPMTDLQGHYLGPASGASFLARVHNCLYRTTHTSSSFTFGDAPLPDYDPTPSIMISLDEMTKLIETFFDFTMAIDRLFHRPTIEMWSREFHETMGSMRNTEDAPARRAILWMVFAMAQEHANPEPVSVGDDRSIRYFLAAEYQLSRKRHVSGLANVQAQLCQCFWLLSRSRMNHCWELFGFTARLTLMLGLHRKSSAGFASMRNPVDLESRRRAFWSAYCLDNHLSITLGRPRIFHDDDIDQDFPSGSDDDKLFTHQQVSGGVHVYPTMLAPVAYFKLYRVLSMVLRDLYPIRYISIEVQHDYVQKYTKMLKEWRSDIPRFLDADGTGSSPLIAIFQRQRDVLSVAYWHAIVLIHRPLFLRNFVKVRDGSHENVMRNSYIESSVSECLRAAMHIVDKVDNMFQAGLMFRSFWGTCYYGFSAAVMLYLFAIQQSFLIVETSPEKYQSHLDAAVRCQNQLSRVKGSGSLVARYCLVLEELRLEVIRRTNTAPEPPFIPDSSLASGSEMMWETNMNSILYAPNAYPNVNGGNWDGLWPAVDNGSIQLENSHRYERYLQEPGIF